jgi:hypothetical protein
MKTVIRVILIIVTIAIITTCSDNPSDITPLSKEQITGFAQKGPFNNGSSVLISELNSDFVQTGRNITSNIKNNQGAYEIDDIEFISQYVTINTNGYYFNEVTGENSSSQLTLYAISDLSEKSSLNLNVLSHLEKERVQNLLSTGKSFEEAKKQAIQEILKVFLLDEQDIGEPELLDISKEGDANSILLAISLIFQGYRSTSDLSLLMANFITDFATDGVLDDPTIQSDLISHASSLDLDKIRENLDNHYKDLGLDYSIPNFEQHINHFIDSSEFEITELINYPENGTYGENILHLEKDTFNSRKDYSFAVILPENGSVKIIMRNGLWFYSLSSITNWQISEYYRPERYQIFTSIQDGVDCDLKVHFSADDSTNQNNIVIEYYEFDPGKPTRIKPITIID